MTRSKRPGKKGRKSKQASKKAGKRPVAVKQRKAISYKRKKVVDRKTTKSGGPVMPVPQPQASTSPPRRPGAPPARPAPTHLAPRVAQWERPVPLDDEEGQRGPLIRGEYAVQHQSETRGRRSKLFPDLNISATAAKLGVTKSHLAKVLSGDNRPSVQLAEKLAQALGVEITYVLALYRRDR